MFETRPVRSDVRGVGSRHLAQRGGLILEDLEDAIEVRRSEDFGHARGRVAQLQRASFACDPRVRADDFANARAVDVGQMLEIQQEGPVALFEQLRNRGQEAAILRQRQHASQIDHDDRTGEPLRDLGPVHEVLWMALDSFPRGDSGTREPRTSITLSDSGEARDALTAVTGKDKVGIA
jgi:hypothetical protein